MGKNVGVVKERVLTTFIARDGNLRTHTDDYKYFLKDDDYRIMSHQYDCMFSLGDDHYAVCRVTEDVKFFSEYSHYDIFGGQYAIANPRFKWGVVRVNRDENGDIIPMAETVVFPYVYDRISDNNLKTATAYNGDKLTYLDLDTDSAFYGQQLVPCALGHACSFGTEFKGFAECSINGVVGYLPRNCRAREEISGDQLLTKAQVALLIQYRRHGNGVVSGDSTVSAYFNLTGEIPTSKKAPEFVKKHPLGQ